MNDQGVLLYNVPYPERLSRLLIFVKWLLIIPHVFVLYFLLLFYGLTTFLAWFAILFTGRYPRGLWDFGMTVLRWNANVSAYASLLRDEYPPFSGADGDYPVRFEMVYPERLSRLLIFVKWLLIVPHVFVLYVLGFLAGIAGFLAWFGILFTGNYPRSFFDFWIGVTRWGYRVAVYAYLMTDVYPPFALGPIPDPPTGYVPSPPVYPA